MKVIKSWFLNACVFVGCSVTSFMAKANVDIPEKDDLFDGLGDGDIVTQTLRFVAMIAAVGLALYLLNIVFSMARTASSILDDSRTKNAEVKDMVAPIIGGIALLVIVLLLGWFVLEMFNGYTSE